MEDEMFGKIYIAILVCFSLVSCMMAIVKPSIFDLHLKNFRRSLYTLFVLCLGIGIIAGGINITNWTYILSLTAIVVFIDLSVLLTPSILKIWQAEFITGSEFLEATIKENEKIQRATVTKVEHMSLLVQDAIYYFEQKPVPENGEEYERELKNYLVLYCEEFGLSVDINQYEADDSIDLDISVRERIKQKLIRIDHIHNFDFNQQLLQSFTDSIFNLEVITLEDHDALLIPIHLQMYNFIIVLKKDKGIPIEVDGVHIANLVHIYDSFM